MNLTYADIKNQISALYDPYVSAGFVSAVGGSPAQIGYFLRFINNRISAKPIEFEFLKQTSPITLTGASTYDLGTLFPDLYSVYQLFGTSPQQEAPYYPNYDGNVTPITGYTLKGKTLIFTGNQLFNGSVNLQYKSKWLVKDADGNRKLDFTNDTDITVLDDNQVNVLIFGVGQFVNWKTDTVSSERKAEINSWFKEAFDDLVSYNPQTSSTHTML